MELQFQPGRNKAFWVSTPANIIHLLSERQST